MIFISNFFSYVKKYKRIIIVFLLVLLIIKSIFYIYKFEFKYKPFNFNKKISLRVLNLENIDENNVSYKVKMENDIFLLKIYTNSEEEKLNASKYIYGDVLEANCKMSSYERLENPYEFNYKRYLNSNNICGTLITSKVIISENSGGNFIFKKIFKLKKDIEDKIDSNLIKEEAGLIKSILLSEKIYLDESIKEDMSEIGISHILSMSSFSIYFMMFLIEKLRCVYSRKSINIFKLIAIIIIFILADFKTSFIRNFIIIIINIIFYGKMAISKELKVIISIYILVLINPYNIFNISLIFSYLSILSIMFFYNNINSFFKARVLRIFIKNSKSYFNKKLLKIISLITKYLCFTICVTISTLPLQIYLYNSFNFITFLSNLIIIPFIYFIRIVGGVAILSIYFFYIPDILFNSCFISLRALIKISKILNACSVRVNIAMPSVISILMYYTILVMIILKDRIIKRLVLDKKYLRNKLYKLIRLVSFIFIIFIVSEQIYINYFEDYVLYFNVKQGNMALIRKDRKTILVDIGSTNDGLAATTLNKYLQAKNIKCIDYLFITHFHEDHVNGIYGISKNIDIKNVAYGKIWHKINEEYKNFICFADDRNINLKELSEGEKFAINANFNVVCICPRKDEKIASLDEINSNSAVYLFSIDSKKFLFMGDATKETETYILSKNNTLLNNICVLQVGHHGSKTSSSENFIKKVMPKISLISSYKKIYNHPSQETLEVLDKYNLNYHITEKNKVLKINL